MSNEKVKIVVALTAGLCVGGGVGYLLAERKIRSEAEKEIAGVKDLYKRLRAEDAAQAREDWESTPVDEAEDRDEDSDEGFEEAALRISEENGYASPDELWEARHQDPNYLPPTDPEPGGDDVEEDIGKEDEDVRKIRVFNPNRDVDPNDVTQWERDPNRPYVITEAEYRIDRPEFEKLSLNYYKGDEVLTEANDSYIPDVDGTAGEDNLNNYFGLASGDERLLHVRNERVGADFEITLNDGAFAREVLGFGIEESMARESKKKIRKMRSE